MSEIRMCRPAEAEAIRLGQEAGRERSSRAGDRKVIIAVEKANDELAGISPADLTGKKRIRVDNISNSSKEIVEPVEGPTFSTSTSMDDAIAVDEVAQKSIYNRPLTGESLQSGSTSTTRGMTGKDGIRRGRRRVKENLNEILKV